MKQKYFILGILITVISLILINVIFVNKSRNEIIYVKDIAGYGKKVTEYSFKIEKIKNEDCKVTLNNMMDYINKTHFEKNVTVKEYYEAYFKDDDSIISLLDEAKDACELEQEEYDSIYISALSSTNYPNKIKNDYLFSYEFKILDGYSRKIYKKDHDNIGTYTTKVLELRVLEELLNEVVK